MKKFLLIGGSRGLGAVLCQKLPQINDKLWVVSRTEPAFVREDAVARHWIRADLANPVASAKIIQENIGDSALDCLIFNAGIWEDREFEEMSLEGLERIISVNLVSLLTCVRALFGNLVKAGGAKVVLIGSTSGLENSGSSSVGYVASKFGVRGAGYALREVFRKHDVTVTCISPGSLSESEPATEGSPELLSDGKIPRGDIARLIQCIIELSSDTCPKEIVLPATHDSDV